MDVSDKSEGSKKQFIGCARVHVCECNVERLREQRTAEIQHFSSHQGHKQSRSKQTAENCDETHSWEEMAILCFGLL